MMLDDVNGREWMQQIGGIKNSIDQQSLPAIHSDS